MQTAEVLGIIAGNGVYPRLLAHAARKAGVKQIVAAAFTDETDPALGNQVDVIEWLRVGQLSKLLKFFRQQKIRHAIMAGQIAPRNLFDLRPDAKALLLLARLKQRVGAQDRARVDQYLDSVRQVESEIERARRWLDPRREQTDSPAE